MANITTESPQAIYSQTDEEMQGEVVAEEIIVSEDMLMATEETIASTTPPLPLDSSFSWGNYFQAIGTLMILLACLWAVVWLLRKYGRFNFIPKPGEFPRDGLRIESQLPLGPRKGLVVVRYLNKRLLLGVTEQRIQLLQENEYIRGDDEQNSIDFQSVMDEASK